MKIKNIRYLSGNLKAIEALIDNGVDINMTNNLGQTALHYALNLDSIDVAKFLISKGADVKTKDKKGITPLDMVVKRGETENYEIHQNREFKNKHYKLIFCAR